MGKQGDCGRKRSVRRCSLMITIRHCRDIGEATMLKLLLEGCGIVAFIPDEAGAGIAPHFFNTESGVRLQVAEEDAGDAREVIAEAGSQG